jgi:hypothetical protein
MCPKITPMTVDREGRSVVTRMESKGESVSGLPKLGGSAEVYGSKLGCTTVLVGKAASAWIV